MTGWRTRLACGSKRKPRSEVPYPLIDITGELPEIEALPTNLSHLRQRPEIRASGHAGAPWRRPSKLRAFEPGCT